ncbi:16S rRNA (uracil(1498)-N(3))-methyltransferase [Sediminibacter sp. Hel_I_10]|uniref:16S rRNA (uracil(1498)-N(3))-methyltransferase n=1 Tax=Sediminibacter sp. Hel_I_10 TaxID=1392490 RepID=UPI00047D0ADE|nr:16S rRNA (uracil(1498)-N(3))-methyltransferase [Sediminibacter sp. Hel_I_10]
MQLFYNADLSETDTSFVFSKDESRHIVKVLRRSTGDLLQITNGKGWLFSAEITMATINHCEAKIISAALQPKHPYQLHLAVAPTKMNDRYEWFLEKATEIGIDSITPIICENSERRVIKKDRFERIIQSAVKQSLHCHMPVLNDALPFKEFIEQHHDAHKFIAHCEDTKKISLKSQLQPRQSILILIGPEGDFSASEIETALAQSFKPVTLGDTRLRTETAAIAACHSVAFVNQE